MAGDGFCGLLVQKNTKVCWTHNITFLSPIGLRIRITDTELLRSGMKKGDGTGTGQKECCLYHGDCCKFDGDWSCHNIVITFY